MQFIRLHRNEIDRIEMKYIVFRVHSHKMQ